MKTKVSGAWKDGIPHVKVAGVWKKAIAEWVKVSGVWKKVAYLVNSIKVTTKLKMVSQSGSDFRIEQVDTNTFTQVPADYDIYKYEVYARKQRKRYWGNITLVFKTTKERDRLVSGMRAGKAFIRITGSTGYVSLTTTNAEITPSGSQLLTINGKSTTYNQQIADFVKRQFHDSPYVTISIFYKD